MSDIDTKVFMTQERTGPTAARRQINLALLDDPTNPHPDQDACRAGDTISLIDWLNGGFEPTEGADETQVADARAVHWKARTANVNALLRSDTTLYLLLKPETVDRLREILKVSVSAETSKVLSQTILNTEEIPASLQFLTYCTYLRIDNKTQFARHKLLDVNTL